MVGVVIMGKFEMSQYNTTVEEFIGLKKLYPMGEYKMASGDFTNRTTWFEFTVPQDSWESDPTRKDGTLGINNYNT